MATKVTDAEYIAKWVSMLKVFEGIIKGNPPVEKVKKQLEDLQQAAINTTTLTPRQREGIYDRCANYLNGTYGVGLSRQLISKHPLQTEEKIKSSQS